jgi:hypothetical protein
VIQTPDPRSPQNLGYLVGAFGTLAIALILFWPNGEQMQSKGPPNTGHEMLVCEDCHRESEGSLRQQVQANVRYYLGLRQTEVEFGHLPVTNENCQECHDRPTDFHPVFRFNEPRFAEARQAIQPQLCVSCHKEHEGKRVTSVGTSYCVHCHQDLEVQDDPITVSHKELTAQGRWETCLTCHDFHGNHVMETPTDLAAGIPLSRVVEYFEGGPDPYSEQKHYLTKEQ